jgi:hypothetical protein
VSYLVRHPLCYDKGKGDALACEKEKFFLGEADYSGPVADLSRPVQGFLHTI